MDRQGLSLILGTIISLTAVLALLLTGFNSLLNAKIDPVKENQARIEKRIDGMEVKMDGMEDKLDQVLFELKDPSHKPPKQAKK